MTQKKWFLVVEASSFSWLKNSTQVSNSRWYHPILHIFQAPFATKPYLSCLGSTGILIHWAFKSAQKHVHMVKGHPDIIHPDFFGLQELQTPPCIWRECLTKMLGYFGRMCPASGSPNQVASWALTGKYFRSFSNFTLPYHPTAGWLTSCNFTKETSAMYIPPLNHWNSQEKLIRKTL